jgi:hypothetical protein
MTQRQGVLGLDRRGGVAPANELKVKSPQGGRVETALPRKGCLCAEPATHRSRTKDKIGNNVNDSDSVRTFASALTEMVNQTLGPELGGTFSPISYPSGFPYFWLYGPNSYYNQATLDLVDKCVSIDSNGVCVFQNNSFTSLYFRILQNVQFNVSATDAAAISQALGEVRTRSDATVAAWESEVGPITAEQITSSGVFPPKKMAYIQQQAKERWAGNPSTMPDTLAAVRTAYKLWTSANWKLTDLQSRQIDATNMLEKARNHTQVPAAGNGGAQVSGESYRVRYQGFAPTNAILGSLNSEKRTRTVDFNNVKSSSDVVMFVFSKTDQQGLKEVSASASSVDVSITYSGLTIIQAQPAPLAPDLTAGWYAEEILTEVVEKTTPGATGFQLTGSEYSVDDLFGHNKKFARVKTFVVSKNPTIKITFHNADRDILQNKYQLGKPIRMNLANHFQFGTEGLGLKVTSVERAGAGGNDVIVIIAPPDEQGSINEKDRTAHILGGVVDFPPVALFSAPVLGVVTVTNMGGFFARFSVQYLQNGEPKTDKTNSFSLFFTKTLQLPADANQILLTIEIETGLNQWSVVATKQYRKPVTKSFELGGTTWKPEIKPVETKL